MTKTTAKVINYFNGKVQVIITEDRPPIIWEDIDYIMATEPEDRDAALELIRADIRARGLAE